MKTGRSLQELAAQITEEKGWKKDFVASTTKLEYDPEPGQRGAIRFNVNGTDYAPEPTPFALRQIGERVGIPPKYVDRMLDGNRDLLAKNVNHWFQRAPEKRMLRTLMNGTQVARAFLSDRYRPLDNADLAEAVLPRLIDSGAKIISSEITETKFYIQAATPKIELDLAKLREVHGAHARANDIVQAGVIISNSEVGSGSIRVEPMIYRLVCYNGLILPTAMRRHHVGKGSGELSDAEEYFTDATRELDDRAFWAKVIDVVSAVLDKGKFESLAKKFADTGSVKLEAGAIDTVELVAKQFRLNEGERKGVLDHLVEGGDLSLFGLVNAVTRTAEDVDNYDRAVELERLGGEIIELPPTMWKKVS